MEFLSKRVNVSEISLGLDAWHKLLPHIFKIHILLLDILHDHPFLAFNSLAHFRQITLELKKPGLELWSRQLVHALCLVLYTSNYLLQILMVDLLLNDLLDSLEIDHFYFFGEHVLQFWFVHFSVQSLGYTLLASFVSKLLLQSKHPLINHLLQPLKLSFAYITPLWPLVIHSTVQISDSIIKPPLKAPYFFLCRLKPWVEPIGTLVVNELLHLVEAYSLLQQMVEFSSVHFGVHQSLHIVHGHLLLQVGCHLLHSFLHVIQIRFQS